MSSIPTTPYSPAVRSTDHIFVSGQIGFTNPETGKDNIGIEAQTRQCLENMKSVLEKGCVEKKWSRCRDACLFSRSLELVVSALFPVFKSSNKYDSTISSRS